MTAGQTQQYRQGQVSIPAAVPQHPHPRVGGLSHTARAPEGSGLRFSLVPVTDCVPCAHGGTLHVFLVPWGCLSVRIVVGKCTAVPQVLGWGSGQPLLHLTQTAAAAYA